MYYYNIALKIWFRTRIIFYSDNTIFSGSLRVSVTVRVKYLSADLVIVRTRPFSVTDFIFELLIPGRTSVIVFSVGIPG